VKLIFKILAAVIALLLIAILVLVLFFDLNMLKPRIEAEARAQGVDLRIGGDIGWTFWPSVGVAVSDIRVAPVATPEEVLAELDKASLLVELMPLFKGNVVVHHVLVDGARIDLKVDRQGNGNWEKLTAEKVPADVAQQQTGAAPAGSDGSAPGEPAEEGQELQLSVERISLSNSALNYTDEQSGQSVALQDIRLDVNQFNLQAQPFDVSLALKTRLESEGSAPMNIAVQSANRVQLQSDLNGAKITGGDLSFVINDSGKLSATYDLNLNDLQGDLRFDGSVKVPAFDAKALISALGTPLQTSESYALTKVALETRVAGNKNSLQAEPLTITLDKTTLTGSFGISDFSRMAMKLAIKGDQIVADDYLAPETQAAAAPAGGSGGSSGGGSAAAPADGDEELIPLEMLKTLNLDANLDFDKITFADIPLEAVRVRLNAANGQVNLTQTDARVYDGTLAAKGSLDARGNTAVIRFDSALTNVQIEPAMKALELGDNFAIAGGINANLQANTRGLTMNQLVDGMQANADFSGAQVRFSPLNIEQKFCELVDLVNKSDSQGLVAWDPFTEMRELSGKITMANSVVNIESVKAGVHQLELGTNGKIDLAAGGYDLLLPMKLLNEETSENGCRVPGNYWINRSLSLLRCHGSLETLNPLTDCRPDAKGLANLTRDFAEFKLREKHGDKIDAAEQKVDQKKEELLQKLDKKLGGEGDSDAAKGLLKGLLKGGSRSSDATGE
jgi:AsmA protein